jgi:hypothetical protein
MRWVEALKIWNAEHNPGKWCVAKKGSPEYDQVRAIMDKHKKPADEKKVKGGKKVTIVPPEAPKMSEAMRAKFKEAREKAIAAGKEKKAKLEGVKERLGKATAMKRLAKALKAHIAKKKETGKKLKTKSGVPYTIEAGTGDFKGYDILKIAGSRFLLEHMDGKMGLYLMNEDDSLDSWTGWFLPDNKDPIYKTDSPDELPPKEKKVEESPVDALVEKVRKMMEDKKSMSDIKSVYNAALPKLKVWAAENLPSGALSEVLDELLDEVEEYRQSLPTPKEEKKEPVWKSIPGFVDYLESLKK